MENSVKALNILWGMLIGLMVLSVLVLVFSKGGQLLFNIDNSKEAENIAAYNAKLLAFVSEEPYSGHTDYKTIFDVISAINLAKDINEQNGYDESNCLEIEIDLIGNLNYKNDRTGFLNTLSNAELINKYGQKVSLEEWEYKFKGKIPEDGYNDNGKICKINFSIVL